MICAGLVDLSTEKLEMKILPNPNNGIFELYVSGLDCKSFQLGVYDLTGNVKYREKFMIRGGEFTERLDMGGIRKGLYLIQLQCADEVVTGKLVIN
jgi:hypothetical protein